MMSVRGCKIDDKLFQEMLGNPERKLNFDELHCVFGVITNLPSASHSIEIVKVGDKVDHFIARSPFMAMLMPVELYADQLTSLDDFPLIVDKVDSGLNRLVNNLIVDAKCGLNEKVFVTSLDDFGDAEMTEGEKDSAHYFCPCEHGWVSLEEGDSNVCPECQGHGADRCSECGSITTACELCDNTGEVNVKECPVCNVDDPRLIFKFPDEEHEHFFSLRALTPVFKLPGAKLYGGHHEAHKHRVFYFTWTHGFGIVQPHFRKM